MTPRHDRAPVACTLGQSEASEQLTAWATLGSALSRTETHPGGARMWFDAAAAESLRSVVAVEAACCAFLDLTVELDGQLVRLDIRSGSKDGVAVAHLLATRVSGEER